MLGRLYFARQATTLLKFAKSTSNPELAASLIERAADLKAQIDAVEKPIPSPHAPDVEIIDIDAPGADGRGPSRRTPQ